MEQFFSWIWNLIRSFVNDHLVKIIAFFAVLCIGYIVIKTLTAIFRRTMNKSRLKGTAGDFLTSLVRILLLAVYFIALLAMLGVPTTSLIALFSAFFCRLSSNS